MNNNQKKAVLRAAVVAGAVLAASTTGAVASASDTPVVSQAAPAPSGAGVADFGPIVITPLPVPTVPTTPAVVNGAAVSVSRLSLPSGGQVGGQWVTVTGKNLASSTVLPTVTFTLPATAKGGSPVTATGTDVTVVSADVIRVHTPSVAVTGKAAVTVTNGSVTSSTSKAASFTFTASAPVAQVGEVDGLTSDTGGTFTIAGTYLGDTKTTKVTVGGTPATVLGIEPGPGFAILGVRLPAGVPAGNPEVVVSTPGGSVDAGTVAVTTATVSFELDSSTISVEKGGSVRAYGSNLAAVTSATLTDAGGHVVTVKIRKPAGHSGEGPLEIAVPSRLAAGTGNLVLNTKYSSSEPQSFTVVKVGKPAFDKTDVAVGRSGGDVVLTGTNLHHLQSVTVGGRNVESSTGEDGESLTLYLPPQTRSSLSVVVTSDGGTATYKLKVVASTFTGVTYDATNKTLTLAGTYLSSNMRVTLTGPDEEPSRIYLYPSQDGTSATFGFEGAPADGSYSVAVEEASGNQLGTKSVSVVGRGTVSGASYDVGTKKITLSGTDVARLRDIVVKDSTAKTVAATFSDEDEDGVALVATLSSAPSAGTYTVTAKNEGGTVLAPVTFTVAAPVVVKGTLSGASYDATTKVITLSGTDLGSLKNTVVTDSSGNSVAATFTATSDGLTSTATVSAGLSGNGYKVNATNSAGAALTQVQFNAAAVVAKGTLSGAAYNPTAKTITLSGTNLGSLTDITVTDSSGVTVAATFSPNLNGELEAPISAGLTGSGFKVNAKNSAGTALPQVGFNASA